MKLEPPYSIEVRAPGPGPVEVHYLKDGGDILLEGRDRRPSRLFDYVEATSFPNTPQGRAALKAHVKNLIK